MGGKGIPIGRIFGIVFRINPSWLIIFILTTWTLAGGYFSHLYPGWSMFASITAGVITSLLFFVSVLVHELMHSVVALRQGVAVNSITLFIFGGVAEIAEEPKKAFDEFIMALAGPFVSLALGGILLCIWFGLRSAVGTAGYISAGAYWLGIVNLSLGICNMVPGFPLDGGRVLRSILWGHSGNLLSATRVASIVGRIVAICIILVGVYFILTVDWFSGVWFVLIGWFLNGAATNSYRQVQLDDLLSRYKVEEAMRQDYAVVSPELGVERLIKEHVSSHGQQYFIVKRCDRFEGMVAFNSLRLLTRKARHKQIVAQLMIPVEQLKWVSPDDKLIKALNLMREHELLQVPVMQDGCLVGVVSVDRLQVFIEQQANQGK